jgi:purine-binding chemotaxis protein CheW
MRMSPANMTTPSAAASASFLVVRVHTGLAALSLSEVLEIMRPLPVEPVAGMPASVLGLSVIRGKPVPVVHLGTLLGSAGPADPTRFVTIRVAGRRVALAVDEVLGVRTLDPAAFDRLPPLLRDAQGDAIEAIGALDRHLLVVLNGARVLSEEISSALGASEKAP